MVTDLACALAAVGWLMLLVNPTHDPLSIVVETAFATALWLVVEHWIEAIAAAIRQVRDR